LTCVQLYMCLISFTWKVRRFFGEGDCSICVSVWNSI
jgi:hypothetical protein